MNPNFVSIVTTINSPTEQLKKLANLTTINNGVTIVIGDTKTVKDWQLAGTEYFSIDQQKRSKIFNEFAKLLPENHYCRKNLGYLYGMQKKPQWIYESDDDNLVLGNNLKVPSLIVNDSDLIIFNQDWVNIFDFIKISNSDNSSNIIWPRGFPLELIKKQVQKKADISGLPHRKILTPIANGIVNGDPDVDAIYRLTNPLPISFHNLDRDLIFFGKTWSPFNSQNTWWHESTYLLMYLPVTTTFRVTDILRSYVAQVIIDSLSMGIRFYGPSAFQERNFHKLIMDFEEEIPLYLNSIAMLETIKKSIRNADNIFEAFYAAYVSLQHNNFVKPSEMRVVESWIECNKSIMAESRESIL